MMPGQASKQLTITHVLSQFAALPGESISPSQTGTDLEI